MTGTPDTPHPSRAPRRPELPRVASAIERLRGLPSFRVLAVAAALLAALGLVDYWAEPDLSFLVFYLFPVFLATIRSGLWAGVLMSTAGTAVWFLANINQYQGRSGHVIPLWNLLETLGIFFFFSYLLSSLAQVLDKERERARYDPLTGVANRRYFGEVLGREIDRSRRYGRTFTLAYMDLDNFKAVNDLQGHEAGDALLCKVAEALLQGTRDTDTPARIGGDEFALLLPETGYDAARTAISNLRGQVAAAMKENGWPVTLTIGAVTCASPLQSPEELIGMADRLMYSKKSGGKDGFAHRIVDGQEIRPPPRG